MTSNQRKIEKIFELLDIDSEEKRLKYSDYGRVSNKNKTVNEVTFIEIQSETEEKLKDEEK